jgi:hypothetical protein
MLQFSKGVFCEGTTVWRNSKGVFCVSLSLHEEPPLRDCPETIV